MDYYLFIGSTASFVETRVKDVIEYSEMEKMVGYSYRHIRETFKGATGISLSRYVLLRRLANSAFDIMHTHKSLIEIASDYMFDSYDTFTRAFKRHTGYLPSELRGPSCNLKVGRRRITVGMFGPVIMKKADNSYSQPQSVEDYMMKYEMENDKNNAMEYSFNQSEKTKESVILYGVPKVAYTFEECTPFCVAMKACLNYLGQQVDYSYIMAITGAAFRLRWNVGCWDGGNVDIMVIYEDPYEAFHRAFRAAGRSNQILKRDESDKEGFKQFIKSEIDEGRPVIAFGIIGPPEACLITGYRDNGNTLLGWNCFQENQEFAKNVKQDESGYFITDSWWENTDTVALISVGEKLEPFCNDKEVLRNALEVMTKEKIIFTNKSGQVKAEYASGQRAYQCWANSVGDDKEFPNNVVLPLLFERIMCQNDAQVMICEGRSYAASYLEWFGQGRPMVEKQCKKAAEYFRKIAECVFKMNEVRSGFMQNEEAARRFAEPKVRQEIVALICKAKEYEARVCEIVKEIIELL